MSFVDNMMIETLLGPVKAGDLREGDMVQTRDNGFEPVAFVDVRTIRPETTEMPVTFAAGTIGNETEIVISPDHLIDPARLPSDMRAALELDEDILVPAQKLCNGTSIKTVSECPQITLVRIMFDDPQLIFCDRLVSESWHPTPKNLRRVPEIAQALTELFPNLENIEPIEIANEAKAA